MPPPILAIIFWNLPIFFIICCIPANLLSMVLSSVKRGQPIAWFILYLTLTSRLL